MSKRPQLGVFLDLASTDRGDLDLGRLSAACDAWAFHEATRPDQVLERVRAAEVVVTNKVVLGADLLRSLPRLRLICVAATGTNNVDLEAAAALGIAVRSWTCCPLNCPRRITRCSPRIFRTCS